jgi:hypothetical protein
VSSSTQQSALGNQWVRQEHENGCVIASVAMVLGRSYRSVHDELAPQIWWYDYELAKSDEFKDNDERTRACWKRGADFSKHGIDVGSVFRWLEENGYATQLRWRYRWGHEVVAEWPPKPFAPIHICAVTATRGSHAIVMLADGTLLDPWREPGSWCGTWEQYGKVEQVCGIWKVA